MSENKPERKAIILKNMPIILKKEKIAFLKKEHLITFNVERSKGFNIPILKPLPPIKEDLIYESKTGDFLKGEFQKITIINKYNLLKNSSRTIAKFVTHSGDYLEKTSDCITRLIGQTNYDTVFSGLCSVISQEHRIRGILALLTENKMHKDSSLQTDQNNSYKAKPMLSNASSQTTETQMNIFNKTKPRRRVKRQQLAPYVVKDTIQEPKKMLRKVIVNVECNNGKKHQTENATLSEHIMNCDNSNDPPTQEKEVFELQNNETENSSLPELIMDLNVFMENSNDSIGKFSSLSVETTPELLNNPNSLLNNVDRYTKCNEVPIEPVQNIMTELHVLPLLDNTTLLLPVKPEDVFHYATTENLKFLNETDRRKLALYQAYMDFKFSMIRDENENLPIHNAILNDDLDLLRRQCIVLNIKNASMDIQANGLTALQMSMYKDTGQYTAMLLKYGADPLFTDENSQTCLHLAAELPFDHLGAVIYHCTHNARNILEENEDLWKPGFESRSHEELSRHLLAHMCKMCDNQGYTALMLASKLGHYNNVKQLIDICPDSINMPMPNTGNTALYLAVGAACTDAADRGNKSKVGDDFRRTIEILMENGGDPSFENLSGSSVNILLTEFSNVELSMLIGNKLTSVKFPKFSDEETASGSRNFDSFMILKDEDGNDNIKEINRGSKRNDKYSLKKNTPLPFGTKLKTQDKTTIDNSKPKIIQNVLLSKSLVGNKIEKNTDTIKLEPPSVIKTEADTRVVDTIRFVITSKKKKYVYTKSPKTQNLLVPIVEKTESPVKSTPYKRKTASELKNNSKQLKY